MKFNQIKILIIAILFPFVSLIGLTFFKAYSLKVGTKITLPISGYDPRDLLSGHFVTYRVEYGVADICRGENYYEAQAGCICLFEDNTKNYYKSYCEIGDSECSLFIKGQCENGRFQAGVERFYIPEARATEYDRKVRSGNSKIVLSIKKDGNALVESLILAKEEK